MQYYIWIGKNCYRYRRQWVNFLLTFHNIHVYKDHKKSKYKHHHLLNFNRKARVTFSHKWYNWISQTNYFPKRLGLEKATQDINKIKIYSINNSVYTKALYYNIQFLRVKMITFSREVSLLRLHIKISQLKMVVIHKNKKQEEGRWYNKKPITKNISNILC